MLNVVSSTQQLAPTAAGGESPWRRRLALCATVATLLVALSALAGFAGRWWWRFELAAHFRVQYFWCLLVGTAALLIARRYRRAIPPGVLLAVHVALLWPFYGLARTTDSGSSSDGFPLRIIALNLHASNQEHDRVLQFIREQVPDVVVFTEVNERWGQILTALSDEFPYSQSRAQRGNFGIAFYSRIPFAACRVEELSPDDPAIVATLDCQGTPVTIFGAHPVPPVAEEVAALRNSQLRRLAELVNAAPAPKIVAGDLNTTSWSPAFADFVDQTGLRDTRLGKGVQSSWRADTPMVMRIPIDHCLVSADVRVTGRVLGPEVGSDHLPVIVDLQVRP